MTREWQLIVPGEDASESVECSRVGAAFRLESFPVYLDTISFGDIFEADESGEELILRRIVQRANRKNYSFLLSENACDSTELIDLLRMVESLDGFWQRVANGLLSISMPADSSYDPTSDVIAL